MFAHTTASHGSGTSRAADVAYRRAWWSLALYPFSFVAAFVIGEGMLSILVDNASDAAIWQVFVAATPALLVFMIPGILAASQGRKAIKLGRMDGKAPALVGAVIGLSFVTINLVSGLLVIAFE